MARAVGSNAAKACAVLGVVIALSAGCSSAGSASSKDGETRTRVRVVASTNVYGNIAERIGGDHVQVTSIISDPNQDPHSYEANTRTRLEISKADLVIKNGGGYDDFVTSMARGTKATVLDAVTISGHKATAGGELNEHVWYDFVAMRTLAGRIAQALSASDPKDTSTFNANVAAFDSSLQTLRGTEAQIAGQHRGVGVAITEPVPLYMLTACGLVNKTPPKFSEAIEEGSDVPVGVLNQTLDLFRNKQVSLLAYNEQTSSAETQQVRNAAKANGIAVVPVTETLPLGKDYISWMRANLAAVQAALA